MTRRRPLLALAAVLVTGACSVGPRASVDPSPSTSAAAILSPSAAPSPTPSSSPTAEPGPTLSSSSPAPGPTLSAADVPHDVPGLEAVLPARIGDVELLRMSQPGSVYAGGADMCGFVCPFEPQLMADGVGATVDDVALAFAFDPSVDHYLLTAWQIAGATGAELRAARIGMYEDAQDPYPIVEDVPVGDDVVTIVVFSWAPDQTEYLVTRDDAIILIRTIVDLEATEITVPDAVAEVVAALP